MSAGTYPQVSLTAYGGEFSTTRYMKVMIGLSLVLHLVLLLLIAGLRLPSKMERPLAAYQVSLVTSPTPSVDPKPVPRPVEPEHPKAPQSPVAPPRATGPETNRSASSAGTAGTDASRAGARACSGETGTRTACSESATGTAACACPPIRCAAERSEARPGPCAASASTGAESGHSPRDCSTPRSAQIGPGRSHPRWNAERDPLSGSNRCSKDVEQLNRAGIDVRCDSTSSASARACDSATFIDE